LYAGDRRPHKNIKKIIDLYVALKHESYSGDLLLVGSQKNYDFDIEEYISTIEGVYILGNVDDSELLNLYLQMDALIFLSKYEGFGLPAVESGMLGKKIIVSDGGALKEVSPSWAFVLPSSRDVSQEARNILHYLESTIDIDPHYGDAYDWNKVSKLVHNKFEKILEI
jgi:glycosyltransferase involved in cell wall biosynthesis